MEDDARGDVALLWCHAFPRPGWQNGGMTDTWQSLRAESDALVQKFLEVLEESGADDNRMILSSLNLFVGVVGSMYGVEVGQEIYTLATKLLMSKQRIPLDASPDPEETKFWNLMAEKGYDTPVAFGSKKAKAARR